MREKDFERGEKDRERKAKNERGRGRGREREPTTYSKIQYKQNGEKGGEINMRRKRIG